MRIALPKVSRLVTTRSHRTIWHSCEQYVLEYPVLLQDMIGLIPYPEVLLVHYRYTFMYSVRPFEACLQCAPQSSLLEYFHTFIPTQLCSCFLINPQYNRVSIYCKLCCCFYTTSTNFFNLKQPFCLLLNCLQYNRLTICRQVCYTTKN